MPRAARLPRVKHDDEQSDNRRGSRALNAVPEVSLAAAVILQAVADFRGQYLAKPYKPTGTSYDHARRFLTADAGDWAHAREAWCAIAGVDPDILRERALSGRLS